MSHSHANREWTHCNGTETLLEHLPNLIFLTIVEAETIALKASIQFLECLAVHMEEIPLNFHRPQRIAKASTLTKE